MHYGIRFYADVIRQHETQPCGIHGAVFASPDAAEAVAAKLLPEIQQKFGTGAGYAVIDDAGRVIAIGPGPQTASQSLDRP